METRSVHFIGIGGSGLSAIARLLLEAGWQVSGSDRVENALSRSLAQAGARIEYGHQAGNIRDAALVVRSSAIPDDNPEVLAARAAGIPVLKRADFLGQLMKSKIGIAIAGTHGKTTTTAMTAWVWSALGLDPSYIIGGVSQNLGTNAHAGQGSVFIIEADEYDRMFHGLNPNALVVTNLEHDHPDCFPTPEEYQQAFKDFVARLRLGGFALFCADDPLAPGLAAALPTGCTAFTYGLLAGSDYRAGGMHSNDFGGLTFLVSFRGQALTEIVLQVPGEHNVRNALAVLALAHRMGLDVQAAARTLGEFHGTQRRFELRGEVGGVAVIDDYAHHPTEIRATLAAARLRYPGRRIWAVWQPHTYTRIAALKEDFQRAFADADEVLVTDVYAARAREDHEWFSIAEMVAAMEHPHARFCSTMDKASAYLQNDLRSGDVLLVLSAGDADRISSQTLEFLKLKGV